jgi:hypothetical protein
MPQNPAGSAPQMTDSTSNANTATANGGMASGNQVSGKIGGSLSFSGGTYLTTPTSLSLNTITSAITVSAWVNATVLNSNYNRIISRNSYSNQDWYMENDGSSPGHILFSVSGNGADITAALSTGTWYYLAMSGNSSDVKAYLNGSYNNDLGVGAGSIPTAGGLGIAADPNGSTSWSGQIDEVRVSNIARSDDWIKTEYNNQSSPSTFYTVGSPVSR